MIPKVINKFLNLFSRMQSFSIYATFKIVITDLFCRYEPNTIDLDQDEFKYSSISLTYRYIIESFDDIWDHRARYWFKILSDHLPDLVDKVWCCSCKDICIVPLFFIHDMMLKKGFQMSFSLTNSNHQAIRDSVFPVLANLIRCISLSFRIRLLNGISGTVGMRCSVTPEG